MRENAEFDVSHIGRTATSPTVTPLRARGGRPNPGRWWLLTAVVCLVPLLATCGGDGPTDVPDASMPGTITVRLTGAGLVGGALFEVEGPVGEVTPVVGVTVLSSASGNTVRVIVHGNLSSGPVVQVALPDIRRAGEVRVRLLELANVQTFEQIPVAEWSLTVDR